MTIEATKLQELTKRILALEEEKSILSEDIKEVYTEAKAAGADTKILRKTIALLRQPKEERQEQLDDVSEYLKMVDP